MPCMLDGLLVSAWNPSHPVLLASPVSTPCLCELFATSPPARLLDQTVGFHFPISHCAWAHPCPQRPAPSCFSPLGSNLGKDGQFSFEGLPHSRSFSSPFSALCSMFCTWLTTPISSCLHLSPESLSCSTAGLPSGAGGELPVHVLPSTEEGALSRGVAQMTCTTFY